MAVNVTTDHQVFPFGDHGMALFDANTGNQLAWATRETFGGQWTIHADGVDDVTADTRGEAITALTEQVLAVLPGSGYSTLVPQGLAGLP